MPIVNEINQLMYERAHYLKCLVNENSVPIHLRVTVATDQETTDALETASFKSSATHLIQPGVVHQGNLASSISISNRSTTGVAAAAADGTETKSTHSNRLKASNQNLNHSVSQGQLSHQHHTTGTTPVKTNANANPNPNPKMGGTDDPALSIIKNILSSYYQNETNLPKGKD